MVFNEEPYGRNDPYAWQLEIFPRLSPEMVARAIVYGLEESITRTEITALQGDLYLRAVEWADRAAGQSEIHSIGSVFAMTGAEPNTEWLVGSVEKQKSAYATALPGIFAVGDVRSGSMKRVASAVGEGSVVVVAIHEYIASCGTD
jgi:thioredoxin reductase (NADPH)